MPLKICVVTTTYRHSANATAHVSCTQLQKVCLRGQRCNNSACLPPFCGRQPFLNVLEQIQMGQLLPSLPPLHHPHPSVSAARQSKHDVDTCFVVAGLPDHASAAPGQPSICNPSCRCVTALMHLATTSRLTAHPFSPPTHPPPIPPSPHALRHPGACAQLPGCCCCSCIATVACLHGTHHLSGSCHCKLKSCNNAEGAAALAPNGLGTS